MANKGYLEPKVGAPSLMRKEKNGMFLNPPSYGEMGGFTSASKLMRDREDAGHLERGGPQAKKNKPI